MTKVHNLSIITTYTKPRHKFTTRLCNLAGKGKAKGDQLTKKVQSQSITIDRQMRRYEVPRLAFINKLDRMRADPWKVMNQARSKLRHHNAAVQVPIGSEDVFKGLVDLVKLKAYYFHGSNGKKIVIKEVPSDMKALVAEKRGKLIETVSEVDDILDEALLSDEAISDTY
ncbi:elongation factor G-1, mitochondrial-like [Lathyrus oleraceus]|uniref:elongation factor G-1, mitochondrial-like n=1 Tax=Pisum sativum TaxID=3888 RepID=UPI001FC42D66|nr:elongation factor G-1, mitochondrial-like [Pisum sativum]